MSNKSLPVAMQLAFEAGWKECALRTAERKREGSR